jgi:hypothetical protein
MKKLILIAALMNSGLAFGAIESGPAASETPASLGVSTVPQDEDQPVVTIEGWRRDRALDAFMRGDFATAEVEFRKNLGCIRRIALQQESGFKQGLVDVDRSFYPPNGLAAAPGIHNLPMRPDQIAERTCHSREWQLYMIGLSQIQLGRFADAKKSLYSVTQMSKEQLLYDAHYRVGLLELLEGDVESANRRLTHLTSMNRRCQAQGDRCEVGADLEAATSYLAHAVADARQGVRR